MTFEVRFLAKIKYQQTFSGAFVNTFNKWVYVTAILTTNSGRDVIALNKVLYAAIITYRKFS